ncbi:MAG: plasmid pRiA4b ORF-3 family protein [Gemmatimonadaceae bacterium]
MKQPILTLKVAIRHIRPPIWRRVEVPPDISLFQLHHVLQAAFGWTDSHLHQFNHRGTYYSAPEREFGMPTSSERQTRLGDLLRRPKDRLLYEYDFGDGWEHDVVVESITEAVPGLRYPRVIAGRRACPPEDVGGVSGYAQLLEAIRDRAHEEHESMLDWVGGNFDPERFDVIEANDRIPRRRASRRSDPPALLDLLEAENDGS